MEFDYTMLRRKIQERYVAEADFARDMRISPASLRQKLRNEGDFTMGQMLKAAQLLGIDAENITKYFFVEKVQKREQIVENGGKGAKLRSRYMH